MWLEERGVKLEESTTRLEERGMRLAAELWECQRFCV
jgi:hypothetical protein